MSIELMSRAWRIAFPSNQKRALLAVYDNTQVSGECEVLLAAIVNRCTPMPEQCVHRCLAE